MSELVAAARDSMLRSLFGILNIEDPAQVRYLTPLMELLERQRVLTLATLNYDRSVENAATLVGVDCHTGIETWLTTGALDWPDDGVRLLKLHGSIDWVFEGDHYERGKLPRQVIRKVTGAEEKARYEAPAVVFGEGGKLRAEGPFLELLLAWAAQLQTADRLLVVGYSFRDTHVNEIVARWFNEDDDRRIVIVDPTNFEAHGRSSFAASLARVNDVDPDQTPPIPRVVHLSGTAATTLRAGVSEVLRGRDADVAETG